MKTRHSHHKRKGEWKIIKRKGRLFIVKNGLPYE